MGNAYQLLSLRQKKRIKTGVNILAIEWLKRLDGASYSEYHVQVCSLERDYSLFGLLGVASHDRQNRVCQAFP